MIKYLSEAAGRLEILKRGMEGNPEIWEVQPENVAKVQVKIDLLKAKEKELETLKDTMATKQAEAHILSGECEDYADRIELIAIGVIGNNQEKLIPYGIALRKESIKKSAPTKVLLPILVDDTDGVGFIITISSDPDAYHYEWEKGENTDASKPNVIPEMKFFKISAKASFVDDDVKKGVRTFYRVRAVNRAGVGPWSEAVSRVQ
jgi:hypothetical protein